MVTFSVVPGVKFLSIIAADDMQDEDYVIAYLLSNSSNFKGRERHSKEEVFRWIEDCFMNPRYAIPQFDEMYVYANTDCAIILRDFVDSWIAERQSHKRMGSWNGN